MRYLRVAFAVFALSAPSLPQKAYAVELMKSLSCALTETAHGESGYCLRVFNTCNTPLISRIREHDGYEKESPEMQSGERAEVCSGAPFEFLGHYVSSGP